MKARLSKTLLAASLCALGIANAGAASTGASGDGPAPQAREQVRTHFDARFKQLDTDGDGNVSKAEAEKGAPHLGGRFGEIDTNQDGKLTPDEMQGAMRARRARYEQDPGRCQAQMKQRFESAWKRADTDGDGALSKSEAEQGMPRLARHFDQIDTSHDGSITLAEVDAARARHPHPRGLPKPAAAPSPVPQSDGG